MRDMELQKELDALKDAPFAKMKDTQLLAIENIYRTDEELISIAKKYMNKIDFKKK